MWYLKQQEINQIQSFCFPCNGSNWGKQYAGCREMAEKYYCIMPTSTVYCSGQRYQSKRDEIQQIVRFLWNHGIKEIELIVASSIGQISPWHS